MRVSGIELLIVEQQKQRARDIYLGNVQWSMLTAVMALVRAPCDVPSYGVVYEQTEAMDQKQLSKEEAAAKYSHKVDNMLERWM